MNPWVIGGLVGAAVLSATTGSRRAPRTVRGQPRRYVLPMAAALFLAWLILAVGVVPAALIAAFAGGTVGWATRRVQRQLRRTVKAELVRFGHVWAAQLRSGRVPADALAAAAGEMHHPALARLFVAISDAARHGDIDRVTELLVTPTAKIGGPPLADLARYAPCWRIGVESGAGLARLVERTANAIQVDVDLHQEVQTALAAPRATIRLLGALPIAGLLFGAVIGVASWRFLFGHPLGLACLSVAVALEVGGLLWCRRIVARIYSAATLQHH